MGGSSSSFEETGWRGRRVQVRDWLERSVAGNQPYDDFTRDLITAEGSSLLNPKANQYHPDDNQRREQLPDALGKSWEPMKSHGVPATLQAVHLPAPDLAQRNRSMIGDIE